MSHRWAILIALTFAGPLRAQPGPSAVLGEPGPGVPRDEPFRPDRPIRIPPPITPRENPETRETFGSLYGIGLLAARNGLPGYGLTWFPGQNVSGQPTDLGFVRQELSIFAPVEHQGPDTAAIGFALKNSIFNTNAILPTSRRPFPNSLWDIGAGVAYAHQFENNWTAGVVVNGGSASDKPFSQANVLNASLAVYLTIPAIDNDFWVVGLVYSPTAEFNYPFPAISYFWRPDPELEVNIGLPFLLKWRPYEDIRFDLFYLPIRTVSARASWEYDLGCWTYASFDWSNDSYFLAERANRGDRLFSYEKRLAAGLQFDLPYKLRLDLSAGYAFDRFYFQGRRYADRDQDRINVRAGVFGAIQLRIQF